MPVSITPIPNKPPHTSYVGAKKSDIMPPLEFLKSAKSKLYELYGPCAANTQVLVIKVATQQYQEMLAKTKNT